MRETLAFIIPLYNEEDVLPLLVTELERFRAAHPEVTQVVFVDDGSTDRTASLVRELTDDRRGYTLLRFSRNFGHQLAITAGLHIVETDAAVVMDADLQDPLSVVDEMIAKWRAGYDVVYGIRRDRQGEASWKRAATYLFYRFFQRMSDVEAPLDTGDFRLVSRPVIEAFKRLEEQQPYVRGLIAWLGFNQIGIEYSRPARAAGGTKYPLRKLWRLATDGLTAFSDRPLRSAAGIGFLVSALSVVGLLWVVAGKLFFDLPAGWPSLIFAAFFFGGLQLFFLGVVGTYLARVYAEVKGRPRFIVRDVWRSDEAAPLDERERPYTTSSLSGR